LFSILPDIGIVPVIFIWAVVEVRIRTVVTAIVVAVAGEPPKEPI
jgi:hypothetical protein